MQAQGTCRMDRPRDRSWLSRWAMAQIPKVVGLSGVEVSCLGGSRPGSPARSRQAHPPSGTPGGRAPSVLNAQWGSCHRLVGAASWGEE